MTPTTLNAAIAAAQEFIRRAKLVETQTVTPDVGRPWTYVEPGRNAAAAKRASLDLTRALADMRRSS